MSNPIAINCDFAQGQFGGGDYYIKITDDHIRAIHSRMLDMGLLPSEPATVNDLLTRDANATPAPASPVDDGLSPETVAAIERGCEDSRMGRVTEMDFSAYASPVDDEATVDALVQGMATQTGTMRGMAIGGIEKIRRGEVPGLTTTDLRDKIVCKAAVDRDAAFAGMVKAEAEVERLRVELNREGDMWKTLRKHTGQDPLTPEVDRASAAVALIERLVSERDALQAEIERLRAEVSARDKASGELNDALGILDHCQIKPLVDELSKERDAAIARTEKHLQCHTNIPCGACITCLNGLLQAAIARADGMERAGAEQVKRADEKLRRADRSPSQG